MNTIHVIYYRKKWRLKRDNEDKFLVKTFKYSEIAFYYAVQIAEIVYVHDNNDQIKFKMLTTALNFFKKDVI